MEYTRQVTEEDTQQENAHSKQQKRTYKDIWIDTYNKAVYILQIGGVNKCQNT